MRGSAPGKQSPRNAASLGSSTSLPIRSKLHACHRCNLRRGVTSYPCAFRLNQIEASASKSAKSHGLLGSGWGGVNGTKHVGIFRCSKQTLAGRVLTEPLEGSTQGQGLEPKK